MKNLKQIYLDKTNKIVPSDNYDYRLINMRKKLHLEFDGVWVRYNKGEASEGEWNTALNKWLSSERI